MADKVTEIEPNIEFYNKGSHELKQTNEDLTRKIDWMVMYAENSNGSAEIKALLKQLKTQKYFHKKFNKKLNQFMTEFCGSRLHPSPRAFKTADKKFKELKEKIERYKKQADDAEKRINQLKVQLGLENHKDDEQIVKNYQTKETKIYSDYVNPDKPFNVREICLINKGQEVAMGEFEEIEDYLDTMKEMGLEEKIRALILAREALLVEDHLYVPKKSLLSWIKEFKDSSKQWVALKGIKDCLFDQGAEVCRVLCVLMYRISKREKLVLKFYEFKSALESLSGNKCFLVTKVLIESLEMVKKQEMDLVAGKQKVISKEELKKSTCEESQIDKLLLQIYHEVYRMDSMLNNPVLPESKLPPSSEPVIDRYNEAVKGIENAVKKLKRVSNSNSIFSSEEFEYSRQLEMVEINVYDMWRKLKESDA